MSRVAVEYNEPSTTTINSKQGNAKPFAADLTNLPSEDNVSSTVDVDYLRDKSAKQDVIVAVVQDGIMASVSGCVDYKLERLVTERNVEDITKIVANRVQDMEFCKVDFSSAGDQKNDYPSDNELINFCTSSSHSRQQYLIENKAVIEINSEKEEEENDRWHQIKLKKEETYS